MADSKISAFSNATALDGTEKLAGVQGGANVNITPAQIKTYASTLVADAINDGTTTIAPSQNAVFDALALKAPLASPALTGNPTAPTQSAGNNSTRVATTAYADALVADAINDSTTGIAPSQNAVFDALALKAPLASPALTGNPTVTTQAVNNSSTRAASTAFVALGAIGQSTQSGTTYTIVEADRNTVIKFTSSSTVTVTIPSGLSANFFCTLVKDGTGDVVLATSGTTIESTALTISERYTSCLIFNKGSEVYGAYGALPTGGLVILPNDVTNNNVSANTIADVTALSFPVTSGSTYSFYFYITYTSAATATGSRWSISGPATPTLLSYRSSYSLSAGGVTINTGNAAYDLPAASNASSVSTAQNEAIIEGVIKPSATGTVIARFASEITSSAIVAKAGMSFLRYQKIA